MSDIRSEHLSIRSDKFRVSDGYKFPFKVSAGCYFWAKNMASPWRKNTGTTAHYLQFIYLKKSKYMFRLCENISYLKQSLFRTFVRGKTIFICFGIFPFPFWSNRWFIRLCRAAFRQLNRILSAAIQWWWFIRPKTNYGIMRKICHCRFLLMIHVKLHHFFQFRWMFAKRFLLKSKTLDFRIVFNHDKITRVKDSPADDSCRKEPTNSFPCVAKTRKLRSQSIDLFPLLHKWAGN